MTDRRRRRKRRRTKFKLPVLILACLALVFYEKLPQNNRSGTVYLDEPIASAEEVPEYSGEPFVYINSNIPEFPKRRRKCHLRATALWTVSGAARQHVPISDRI